MLQTSTSKRSAPDVPHDERPTKRATTSPPEEGELDDSSPHSPPPHTTIPLPPKPAPSKFETKVKFPFKKKLNGADPPGPSTQRSGLMLDRRHTAVYDRSEEDERRIREDDHRGNRSRNYHDQSHRRGPPQINDHWEPSYSRDRPAWDIPRDPYRSVRDTYIPSRDRYDGRGYTRERDSFSSLSPDRSRSPSPSSSHRGKHRLPSRRSPVISYSPPRRDYGLDRLQDQRMRDDGRERARHDHHRAAPMEIDNYSRDDDRYHRPMRHSPRRDRSWDSYDRNHPTRIEGGRDTDRDSHRAESYHSAAPRAHDDREEYRLVSPGQPISHNAPQCPPSPSTSSNVHPFNTPPPPPSSPPPVPAPERPKDETLPPHAAISIAIPLKRPPAPRDAHSPSPLPLPSAHEELVKDKKDTTVDVPKPPPVDNRRRRIPLHRTRKQEMEAYGRVFLGCGQQSDYDATAKLGEGTFGYVLVCSTTAGRDCSPYSERSTKQCSISLGAWLPSNVFLCIMRRRACPSLPYARLKFSRR